MSPAIINLQLSDSESVDNLSYGSDSDVDDVQPLQPKTPLREQFIAAGPHQDPVDIDWVPNYPKYLDLVLKRRKAGLPSVELPHSFPSCVQGEFCWSGEDINLTHCVTYLQAEHKQEIEQALHHFKALGLSKDHISPETFPLPLLASVLAHITTTVHTGRGFAIVRGLDPLRYNFQDNIIIYAGIASYIGAIRGKQDNDGNILVHIKDVGSAVASDDLRQSPYANNAQPFHNDLGDVIALYCMDKAEEGGISKLASTAAVYNELALFRPDLVQELAAPNWAFDKHDGSQQFRSRPVLFHDSSTNKVSFCFSRRQLTGSKVAPRPSFLPQLSEAQAEALDAVHFTAAKHAIDIQLERGDIQFSNNLALFHAREAFRDGVDSNKRHMIRMWLRNEEQAGTTPPELHEVWDEIYGDSRRPVWYMSPNHERAHVINRNKSCHG